MCEWHVYVAVYNIGGMFMTWYVYVYVICDMVYVNCMMGVHVICVICDFMFDLCVCSSMCMCCLHYTHVWVFICVV